MKILLINPTVRESSPPLNFPAGLGIIAAIMRKSGCDVHVYDQNALRVSNAELVHNVQKIDNPDVIGIGGLITTYARIKELIIELRRVFPEVPIVLGGGVTVEPDVIFENMPVDFCVHGEGEHTFRELCFAIKDKENDFSQIHGISYIYDEKIIRTPPRVIEKCLDRFPMPAYDLFPAEVYFKSAGLYRPLGSGDTKGVTQATLLWSRGCPNECTFCWRMTGRTMRFRSVDLVMEEIAYLRSNYNVDSYLFYDECINASRKRAFEFAEELIKRGYSAPWYSHARANRFDNALADKLKRSGCVGLNFGIESGSREMLKQMKKNVDPDQAALAVRTAMDAGITPFCTFILGTPGETRRSVMESIKWIRQAGVTSFQFFFSTPYPGCELYNDSRVRQRIRAKFKTHDAFFKALGDAHDLCVNLTDFSDDELLALKTMAISKAIQPSISLNFERFAENIMTYIMKLYRLIISPSRWSSVIKNRLRLKGWYEFHK